MPKNKSLSDLTTEELDKKKKQSFAIMTSFAIIMIIAMVILIYLSLRAKKYALLGIPASLFGGFIPIYSNYMQIENEIKSRQSTKN